jgi:uncharacterized protein YjbI with pentapeptide repeats
VECPQRSEGCTWTGVRHVLAKHNTIENCAPLKEKSFRLKQKELQTQNEALLQRVCPEFNEGMITLDVGGTRHTVSRSILLSKPGSLLSALFQSREGLQLPKDRFPYICLDRDPESFAELLYYLRCGKCRSLQAYKLVLVEAAFWHIDVDRHIVSTEDLMAGGGIISAVLLDLSSVILGSLTFRNSRFDRCIMPSRVLGQATLRASMIDRCSSSNGSINFCLQMSEMVECRFRDLDYIELSLSTSQIQRCDFVGSTYINIVQGEGRTAIVDCNFSNSTEVSIHSEKDALKVRDCDFSGVDQLICVGANFTRCEFVESSSVDIQGSFEECKFTSASAISIQSHSTFTACDFSDTNVTIIFKSETQLPTIGSCNLASCNLIINLEDHTNMERFQKWIMETFEKLPEFPDVVHVNVVRLHVSNLQSFISACYPPPAHFNALYGGHVGQWHQQEESRLSQIMATWSNLPVRLEWKFPVAE